MAFGQAVFSSVSIRQIHPRQLPRRIIIGDVGGPQPVVALRVTATPEIVSHVEYIEIFLNL